MKNVSDKAEYVFEMLSSLEQKWRYVLDRKMKEWGLTRRQFEFLVQVNRYFHYEPSVQEVAEILNTSHQNVMQLAGSLKRKGFLRIENDSHDRRVLRLSIDNRPEVQLALDWYNRSFIPSLFTSLSDQECQLLFDLLIKLILSTDEMLENKE